MLLFQSEEWIDKWCKRNNLERGRVLTLQQVWELSKLWYGDRMSIEYHGRSLDEAASILKQVGLIPNPNPKLFGLPRPFVGALIGIAVFLLLFLLVRVTELPYLMAIVFFPYYVSTLFFGKFVMNLSQLGSTVFFLLVSSIPPTALGSIFFSNKKFLGISLLIIYLVISCFAGSFILFMSS